jgi:preprotein translocase subunit SecD
VNPTAPVTSPPPKSVFPTGSDADVPTQPAGKDASGWAAWQTAASALANGGGPTCAQIEYYQGLDNPDKPLLACDEAGTYVYLLDKTLIPGTEISDATSGLDTQGGHGWVINVTFKSGGFSTWSTYTTGHVGTQTAFTLDGQVLSAPSINEPITTATTMVSGSFTQTSAKSLADSLKFGALPLAFDRQESEQVSAELGFQYLKAGLIAGGIGLALVVIYCLIYYRLLGLITILSLVLSGGLVYAVMVLLGRWIGLSLDMAGIAGLIIAIGITADSFVVYFERIKDEVREGRTFRSAVPRGWARAKRTILSADAVSFLSAAILYILAVGDVKGFAFTLGLSTVLDLVVVFLVTHPLVALASGAKVFGSPLWSGLGSVARAGLEHRTATARLQAKEA